MADSGIAMLDSLIERLKVLGGAAMPEMVAAEVAPLVDDEIKRTVRAGQAPLGAPWPLRKAGGQALVHAADHIVTAARGVFVASTLTGVDVFHHKGLQGKPRRQVLPDAVSVSPALRAAVIRGASTVFRRVVGGE